MYFLFVMTILAPDGSVIQKPFKITHNNKDSLEKATSAIKKAEELYSLESRTFLESTGIYHFPLFCYLTDCGFHTSIINPIITHSSKNGNIRKVKHDKIDSKGIAKLGLSDDVPVSQFPTKLVLEIRSLTRKYYDLTDERSSHVNKLMGDLHTVFPQYLDIFCDITGKTSTMILRQYGTPDKILRGQQLVAFHQNEKFIQQIKWLCTIPGVGFLTAVTIMCEIGDFSAFRNPKQLIAYFGLLGKSRRWLHLELLCTRFATSYSLFFEMKKHLNCVLLKNIAGTIKALSAGCINIHPT